MSTRFLHEDYLGFLPFFAADGDDPDIAESYGNESCLVEGVSIDTLTRIYWSTKKWKFTYDLSYSYVHDGGSDVGTLTGAGETDTSSRAMGERVYFTGPERYPLRGFNAPETLTLAGVTNIEDEDPVPYSDSVSPNVDLPNYDLHWFMLFENKGIGTGIARKSDGTYFTIFNGRISVGNLSIAHPYLYPSLVASDVTGATLILKVKGKTFATLPLRWTGGVDGSTLTASGTAIIDFTEFFN